MFLVAKERKRIYPRKQGRLAGAYLIDLAGAESIIKQIKAQKVDLPIDWLHNLYSEKGVVNMFWSHPVIAVQGSLDGTIKSLIDSKSTGKLRVLSFKIQRLYKRLIVRHAIAQLYRYLSATKLARKIKKEGRPFFKVAFTIAQRIKKYRIQYLTTY